MKAIRSLSFLGLLLSLFVLACKNDDDTGTPAVTSPVRYVATLNGLNEKPTSTTSTATGSFVGNLDPTSRVLSYTVTYAGLTPTMGHIHRITNADGTGPAIVPFSTTVTSGTSTSGTATSGTSTSGTATSGTSTSGTATSGTATSTTILAPSPITGTTTMAQSRIDSMNNGQLYINLHTTRYPNGEIRGDVRKQ